MRLKQTILTLLLAFASTAMWAQEMVSDAKIIVWLKDGTTTTLLFRDMPEIQYADGNVIIQNGDTQVSWPIANLDKLTFEDLDASIPTNVKDMKTAKLDIARSCAVYDTSGKLVKKEINSLSELPAGTYIVKDGSVTYKVVRK